jgi:hypothetical protein
MSVRVSQEFGATAEAGTDGLAADVALGPVGSSLQAASPSELKARMVGRTEWYLIEPPRAGRMGIPRGGAVTQAP